MESRSKFNNYYVPGLFAVAKEAFKRYPDIWKQFFSLRTSKKAYEESGYISGLGYLMNKEEGTPFKYDQRIQGPVKRWVHDTFALGVRVTQEAIEDDLYSIMKTGMKELSVSARATRHLRALRLILTGETTTYHTAGDGLSIFNAAHIRLDGGTWSNLGVAATPTEASLEAAILNFENITDHRGKLYDRRARTVWSGPQWKFRIPKLLKSAYEPETANNAINPLADYGLKYVMDPLITDGRWGIMGEKDSDIGLIWFDRVKPTMSRHGDPDTGDAKFVIRERSSVEANDPRQIYMIPE